MDQRDAIIVLLVCVITCVHGQLSITLKPQNTAQYVGKDVEMECEFSTSAYELTWSECISDPGNCKPFNRDGIKLNPPVSLPRYARYSTINRTSSPGERYDLLITGTQLEDGGQFKCADGTNTVESYAEIIALDGEASCSRNLTTPNEVEEGSGISMTCTIKYQGRWTPKMEFRDPLGSVISGGTVDQSTPGTILCTEVVTANRNHQTGEFRMQAMFDQPTSTLEDYEATNTPAYPSPDTYRYPTLTVWYPPENERVNPDRNEYYLGDTITAIAEGNPLPTQYQWTDLNNTETVIEGPDLKVTEEMLDGTSHYKCKICNTYFSADQCIYLQIAFTAYVTTTTPTTTTASTTTIPTTAGIDGPTADPSMNAPLSPGAIAGIAVGCAAVVILAIVLVVVCCMRKKKAQQSKDSRHPAHGPPRVHGDAVRQPDIVNNKPGPYPDEKVGYAPYDQQGPYSNPVGSPYSDVEQPDDPRNRNEEGLMYADLALEDVPRSRKPIQVMEATEYAEIRRV